MVQERHEWTDEMKALAVGMHRAGMPMKLISARMGLTPKSIQNQLSKAKSYSKLDHKPGRLKKGDRNPISRAHVIKLHEFDELPSA